MRKLITILFFVILMAPASLLAQEQTLDLQFWSMTTNQETRVYPWVMYYGHRGVVLDFRYNFDAKKTLGVYVGKQFGGEKLYVIPQIGYLAGDFNGVSPEFYLGASAGRVTYFSQWQWAQSSHRDVNSWAYQYNDVLVKVAGPISLGVDSQTFWEKNSHFPVATDIGPVIKVDFGKGWSIRSWPAFRTFGHDRGDYTVFFAIDKVIKWK